MDHHHHCTHQHFTITLIFIAKLSQKFTSKKLKNSEYHPYWIFVSRCAGFLVYQVWISPQSLWGRGTAGLISRDHPVDQGGKCSCWSTDAWIKKV